MSIVTAPLTPAGATRTAAASTPTTTPATTSSSSSSNTLTQADFLKIMVAQFTNQDPLSSSDGSSSGNGTSDYVNELMSMTNLTTMQTMSQQQSMELAGTLPGSTVVLSVNGAPVSGVVQNASIENATLYVTIGGTQYPATDLVSITQTQAQAQAASAATAGTTPATTTP